MSEIVYFRWRTGPPPPPPDPRPRFPLYLLPALRIPFRRRRVSDPARSPPTTTSEPASPHSDSLVPSLSSSPVSANLESPPTSPETAKRHPLTTAAPAAPTLGRTQPDTLRCARCATDLAFHAQIVSKGFMGRHGPAYLVSPPSAQSTPSCPRTPLSLSRAAAPEAGTAAAAAAAAEEEAAADLINISVGRPEERILVTGPHIVADISCAVCGAVVGWKYVDARDPAQRYKVGKFILEKRKVIGFRSWEDVPRSSSGPGSAGAWCAEGEEEEEDGDRESLVVFDSQDEDECDDIFGAVWDAKVVATRRRIRAAYRRRNSAGGTA